MQLVGFLDFVWLTCLILATLGLIAIGGAVSFVLVKLVFMDVNVGMHNKGIDDDNATEVGNNDGDVFEEER